MIIEKDCKEALNNIHSSYLPYNWDLNIYRGCSHACQYCFALYSHTYFQENFDFMHDIIVKKNIVQKLEEKLKHKKWGREVINIGGVTDSYQSLEAEYQFMPEILKLLIKYKTPAFISTKSKLVLRDIALLEELASVAHVSVAETIITANDELRKKLEPGASEINERFKVLKELAKTKVTTGVHLMPIIPLMTDDRENLEKIYYYASRCNVKYVLPSILNLKGITKSHFMGFVQKNYPEKFEQMSKLYKTGFCEKGYKETIFQTINQLKLNYHLNSYHRKVEIENEQLTLKIQ